MIFSKFKSDSSDQQHFFTEKKNTFFTAKKNLKLLFLQKIFLKKKIKLLLLKKSNLDKTQNLKQ